MILNTYLRVPVQSKQLSPLQLHQSRVNHDLFYHRYYSVLVVSSSSCEYPAVANPWGVQIVYRPRIGQTFVKLVFPSQQSCKSP